MTLEKKPSANEIADKLFVIITQYKLRKETSPAIAINFLRGALEALVYPSRLTASNQELERFILEAEARYQFYLLKARETFNDWWQAELKRLR